MSRRAAVLAVLVAACLFGTTGTALENGPEGVTTLGASFARLLIGGLALCIAARVERPTEPRPWAPLRGSILVSGSGMAVYQLSFFAATSRTGVATATVITIGSGPVFAGLVQRLLTRRRPTRPWYIGTLCGIVGVVALGLSGAKEQLRFDGVLLALLAGLGWAGAATVCKTQIGRGLDSTASMAATFTTAAVLLGPGVIGANLAWMSTGRGVSLVVYLGIVTVGVGYYLYGRGLRRLDAATVITLTLAEPVVAAVLSVVVLHHHIALVGWVGVALVLAGLMVTARSAAQDTVPGDAARQHSGRSPADDARRVGGRSV